MGHKNILVICFSTAGMDAQIWTNKQHLMSRLSNRPGYEIIYVDRGMSKRALKKAFAEGRWSYFFKPVWKFNDQMVCFSFYFLPLLKGGKIKDWSWKLLHWFLSLWIDEEKYDQVIYWTYQPQSWYLLKDLPDQPKTIILYDCVDDFKSQPFYEDHPKRKEELMQVEDALVKKADYVITTSQNLYKDKLKINKSTYHIHNVGDFNHFKKPNGSLPDDLKFLKSHDKQIVTYAGVVDDYKIDLELINKVADHDEYLFLFLGPVRVKRMEKLFKHISAKDNVLFYGFIDYFKLPSVLHESDIIWLPYQNNEHTKYVFPLKLFEAFATGKKVVARSLPSYDQYTDAMILFDNEREVLEGFKSPFDKNKSMQRIQIAAKNSWENRLTNILDVIGL